MVDSCFSLTRILAPLEYLRVGDLSKEAIAGLKLLQSKIEALPPCLAENNEPVVYAAAFVDGDQYIL